MNTRIHTLRIQWVAFSLLLLCAVQWAHGSTIICIGADGHIAFELPAAKDCCTKNENMVPTDAALHSSFDSCVDISVWARKYTVSTNYNIFSTHNDAVTVCPASTPCLLKCSFQGLQNQVAQYPHSRLLARLKTVILLV